MTYDHMALKSDSRKLTYLQRNTLTELLAHLTHVFAKTWKCIGRRSALWPNSLYGVVNLLSSGTNNIGISYSVNAKLISKTSILLPQLTWGKNKKMCQRWNWGFAGTEESRGHP